MERLLDIWALRRLTKHLSPDDNLVLIAGIEHGGGHWAAYKNLDEVGGRPTVVWGIPPRVVDEWTINELEDWLSKNV